ncbi:MAG: hypothetical protein ACYTEQ_21615 [Planctomycetota bacterium]|jgi:hypothetical protein
MTRHYFGWCGRCDCGFEVVQFKDGEHWRIHKYRYYTVVKGIDGALPSSKWQVAYEMPKPAPVVLGPGGDYDQPVELSAGHINLLESLRKALHGTQKILDELLRLAKGEGGN